MTGTEHAVGNLVGTLVLDTAGSSGPNGHGEIARARHTFQREKKMHVEQMNRYLAAFMDSATRQARSKNLDYHPDKVAMLEILQTAFETNITVEQDLWARIRKQMSALRRYAIEGRVESESPTSRMTDVAVYMAIMDFWFAHRTECVRDAAIFIANSRPCEIVGDLGVYRRTCDCDRCNFLKWLDDYAYTLPSSGT